MKFIRSLLSNKRGVSSLEYAILAAVVIGVVSTAMGNSSGTKGLASDISKLFSGVSTELSNATTTTTGTTN